MSVWLLWNSLSASRRWSLFSRSFIFIISSSSSFFRLVSHHPIPPVLLFSPSPSFRFDFDFVSVSPPVPTLLLHPRPPLFPPSLGESGSESRDGARLRQCFMFTKETVGIPVCAVQEPLCCISLLFHTRPPTSPIQTSNSAAPSSSSSSWREAVSTAALRSPRSPISRRLDLLREAEIDLLAAIHVYSVSNERDAGSWKLETEVRETSSSRAFLAAAASCSVGLVIHSLRERMEAKGTLPHDDDEADLLSVQCVKNIMAMAMLESVLTSGNQGEGEPWRLECGTRGRPTYKCPMGVNIETRRDFFFGVETRD